MKTSALIVAGLAVVTLSVSACASVEEPDSFSSKGTSTKTAQTKTASEKTGKKEKSAAKKKPEMTSGQKNALEAAQNYLDTMPFSKAGLIQQLSSSAGDGYPKADATFAANHVGADWSEEAVEAAQNYLDTMPFSKAGLIEQLSSSAGDKYTRAQARYAASKVY